MWIIAPWRSAAVIAAPDAQHIWVATDTGAILRLVE